MKRVLLYLCILCVTPLLFPSNSWATCDASCTIQDAPAPELEAYIDNVSKVLKNVRSAVWSTSRSEKESNSDTAVLAWLSEVINFRGYFSSFDFYVALPITNEVPYPLQRDHKRLTQQDDRLNQTLKSISRRGYSDVPVPDVCNGVENCNLEWNAVWIITELIKNNKNITDFYRLSILDRSYLAPEEFIIVPENFSSEMKDHYNKFTLYECSSCEWGYADRVKKSIDEIGNLNADGTEWIRKWKDAWAQLTGAAGQSTKTAAEDRVLRQKLADDGIQWDAAGAVIENLQNYGSGWLSTNNPLFNSLNYTFTNAKRDVDAFTEWAIENYFDTDQEEIPIVVVTRTTDEIQKTEDIRNNIEELYAQQLPFAAVQDTATEKLISKIIRMHYTISNSINTLDGTIQTSEHVCNSQWQGKWKCEYR